MRVLVVGGYGTFGERVVRLLMREQGVVPIVTGRDIVRAARLADELGYPCEFGVFDRKAPDNIGAFAPDVVIDASGPFQASKPQSYPLIRTCIAAGVDYVDLADGREFIAGVPAFDTEAKQAGVFVLSGASSYPALSFAAVRSLLPGFGRVDEVMSGIAPSPRVVMGENVIRAIASYAGKAVPAVGDARRGMIDGYRYTVGVDGGIPLRSRRFLLVDTPDLAILRTWMPNLSRTFTGAGTEPAFLQGLLGLLARLVASGMIPSLTPIARSMHLARKWIPPRGEHRGGMFVELGGTDHDGQARARSWSVIAEGDAGPFIPASAAVAVVRRCIRGRRPLPGARSAAFELELDDFREVLEHLPITFGERTLTQDRNASLYRIWLGSAFDGLPASVRAMHGLAEGTFSASGTANVRRGGGFLSKLVANVVGFPKSGEDITVSVEFRCVDGAEIWTRNFGGRKFRSSQSLGAGKTDALMIETFGPVSVALAPVVSQGRLSLVVRQWSLFGIPMPGFLSPRGETFEEDADGRFRFDVRIESPLTGLIVAYSGTLGTPIPSGS